MFRPLMLGLAVLFGIVFIGGTYMTALSIMRTPTAVRTVKAETPSRVKYGRTYSR